MKQPRLLFDKDNSALIGRVMDCLVVDGAAGSSNVLRTRLVCAENVVDKRELGRLLDPKVSQTLYRLEETHKGIT